MRDFEYQILPEARFSAMKSLSTSCSFGAKRYTLQSEGLKSGFKSIVWS